MSRFRFLLVMCSVLVLAALAALVLGAGSESSTVSRFVPGPPASTPPYTWYQYQWNTPVPFKNDKIWVWTAGAGTNFQTYGCDLKKNVILGELFNTGVPALCSQDGSRLLCEGPESALVALKVKLRKLADAVFKKFGRGALPAPNRTASFWLLDDSTRKTTWLGQVSQSPNASGVWLPSPNSASGFMVPAAGGNPPLILCDLENKTLTQLPRPGPLQGWWDDRHRFGKAGTNHSYLFDLVTRQSSDLFTPGYISNFLSQAGLTNDPAGLAFFSNWNGHDYDFFFGAGNSIRGLVNPESFLLKADKSGPALKLLYRNFTFHWLGRLDDSATHYLYPGESGQPGKGGNGAVYLENLLNGTTLTLVPADNSSQYSIPRFHANEVIYFRNRMLRRVRIDGSTDQPLFPPSPTQPAVSQPR